MYTFARVSLSWNGLGEKPYLGITYSNVDSDQYIIRELEMISDDRFVEV